MRRFHTFAFIVVVTFVVAVVKENGAVVGKTGEPLVQLVEYNVARP